MNLCLVSLDQKWEDKAYNMLICKNHIEKAMINGIDLVIFPEMTLTGFSMAPSKTAESLSESLTIEFFKEMAVSNSISIIFGLCLKESNGYTNAAVFVNKYGEINGVYRKIHPFSFVNEDKYFLSGNELSFVDFMGYKVGLSICYDLRFPELYRLYANQCVLMFNIANWPEKRVNHWNSLLKARAIENQFFMIGVNRIGKDNNELTYELSSIIISPEGNIIAPTFASEDLQFYTIQPTLAELYRDSFPVLNDVKFEIRKRKESVI